MSTFALVCTLASLAILALAAPLEAQATRPFEVEVRVHNGRPLPFIDGKPTPLASYCPSGWNRDRFMQQYPRFAPHKLTAQFISLNSVTGAGDFFSTQFWVGDKVDSEPMGQVALTLDEQAERLISVDPDTRFFIRFFIYEPATWRKLHPEELFISDDGAVLQIPSMASDDYWERASQFAAAVVRHCESRPWSHRIIGYVNYHRVEGSHEPLIQHLLFDHSPVMTARWRKFLREKYKSDAALQQAHSDPKLTLDTAAVPRDKLRGPMPEVAAMLYFQGVKDNQPLRDYLELNRDLFHASYRKLCASMAGATDRKRLFLVDALKQVMLGWSNWGFFEANKSWPIIYPELNAGSGSIEVASLLDIPGHSGLATPHDYQARGIGGVFEPEAIVDSAVLRGRLMFAEMDQRTWTGADRTDYGSARNLKEFDAITWRNVATALTRGFQFYWMDLSTDWFPAPEMHQTIAKQVEVVKQSVDWPHATVPGIAMILDDSAALETNGGGQVMNEHIMWEWKMGIARCGVPHRKYLFEDLYLDNFPEHAVYYFPNLYRVDDKRLEILRRKVFRNGHVVVWGPGSGISDGVKIGPESAQRLTGFEFDFMNSNHPRRTLVSQFEHPITRGLPADMIFGSPLSFGPQLFPRDGTQLGIAWTKMGRHASGLSVKSFGRGGKAEWTKNAQATQPPIRDQKSEIRDSAQDWASVFTTAAPLPADLWRNLARFGGAHVYCDSNDVLMADASVVALHSIQPGEKIIRLPGRYAVRDLVAGRNLGSDLTELRFTLHPPETRVFLLRKP